MPTDAVQLARPCPDAEMFVALLAEAQLVFAMGAFAEVQLLLP
jgi:hypothetical protein